MGPSDSHRGGERIRRGEPADPRPEAGEADGSIGDPARGGPIGASAAHAAGPQPFI